MTRNTTGKLVATGGLLYTLGGIVYGLKRPKPGASVVRVP